MLRVSKLTDYATVLMSTLARLGGDRHSVTQLADLTGLARPTVSKLLKQLHHAGLVESERGARGGYQLAGAAEDIKLVQIVEAIEGPIVLTECASHPGQCDIESRCTVRSNWQLISHTIVNALQGVSLTELSQPVNVAPLQPFPPAALHSSNVGTEATTCP